VIPETSNGRREVNWFRCDHAQASFWLGVFLAAGVATCDSEATPSCCGQQRSALIETPADVRDASVQREPARNDRLPGNPFFHHMLYGVAVPMDERARLLSE
jgi:hypothetical protein